MNDTRKERFTYTVIHRPKRDIVVQITDLHKTPIRGKSSCTFTLMAKGDKVECHVVQRQREFYTENFVEQITKNNKERSDFAKLQKIAFIVQA